jgi:hypothetical protein
MSNRFSLVLEGGLKYIKCFKGGAMYIYLGTSALDLYKHRNGFHYFHAEEIEINTK